MSNIIHEQEVFESELIKYETKRDASGKSQSIVDYGGTHPFEQMAKRRKLSKSQQELDNDNHTSMATRFTMNNTFHENILPYSSHTSRSLQFDRSTFEPIRITTDFILPTSGDQTSSGLSIEDKNDFIQNVIVPEAINFWSRTISVYPARGFVIRENVCAYSSREDIDVLIGVQNADLKLYVNGRQCSDPSTIASAGACDYDQYDRPIAGTIIFCYNILDNQPLDQSRDIFLSTAIHELLHVFGFKDDDFPYFFDIETGLPRTQRPLQMVEIPCVGGENRTKEVELPSENTLQMGFTNYGVRYYAIVTPRVKQVVRNHFDCQEMIGARLENQPTGSSCIGDHWEERLFFHSLMSAGFNDPNAEEYLTPLTLALLEDSGWYLVNYSQSVISPFGHGAGCDFVNEPCIVDGMVPEYGKGYFCNTTGVNEIVACDPTHKIMAQCDLVDFSRSGNGPESAMQYFPNEKLGGKFSRADFCPTYTEPLASCENFPGNKIYEGEEFGIPTSRCFNTDDLRPYCLDTNCNEEDHVIEIKVSGSVFARCDFDGQQIQIEDHLVECPKFSVMCPNMVCEHNCRGLGVCKFDSNQPQCDVIPDTILNSTTEAPKTNETTLQPVPATQNVIASVAPSAVLSETPSFISSETPSFISSETPSSISLETPSSISLETPSSISLETPSSISSALQSITVPSTKMPSTNLPFLFTIFLSTTPPTQYPSLVPSVIRRRNRTRQKKSGKESKMKKRSKKAVLVKKRKRTRKRFRSQRAS